MRATEREGSFQCVPVSYSTTRSSSANVAPRTNAWNLKAKGEEVASATCTAGKQLGVNGGVGGTHACELCNSLVASPTPRSNSTATLLRCVASIDASVRATIGDPVRRTCRPRSRTGIGSPDTPARGDLKAKRAELRTTEGLGGISEA